MAIAKAYCHGSALTECVQQDLTFGDGGRLESGDSVEIKYTAHLFEHLHGIGQVVASLVVAIFTTDHKFVCACV